MEVAITKISSRGQLVIPQEIRKDAHIQPETKFIVFNEDSYILLKPIKKQIQDLQEEMDDIKDIRKAEEQFKKGEYIEMDIDLSAEEMLKKIEEHKW